MKEKNIQISSVVDKGVENIFLSNEFKEIMRQDAPGVDINEVQSLLQGYYNTKIENIGLIAFSSPLVGLYITLTTIMARGIYGNPTIQEGLGIMLTYATSVAIAFNRNNNALNIAQKPAENLTNHDLTAALISEGVIK